MHRGGYLTWQTKISFTTYKRLNALLTMFHTPKPNPPWSYYHRERLDPATYSLMDPMVEDKKTRKLGRPKEIQLVLGWIAKTRVLTAAHQPEKLKVWMHDINETSQDENVNHKTSGKLLENLLGQLNMLPLFYR
jgi:hypothetical protein